MTNQNANNDRAARLKAAMRENLKRRKSAARKANTKEAAAQSDRPKSD
ncbi:MAG: hypothetical protein ACPGCY_08955 [Henriciella sp.]